MASLEDTPVVTCFLRNRGEILLLKRSSEVDSYPGRWGGVSGFVDGDIDETARKEIAEETGLEDKVTFVRRGGTITVADEDLGKRWQIHPFLFDAASRDVSLNYEAETHDWVSPTAILERDTVPELWAAYAQVAPSLHSIRADREHGAAFLSVCALAVLRDWAGRLAWQQQRGQKLAVEQLQNTIFSLADDLINVRPAMAVVRNRINRVMQSARGDIGAIPDLAHEAILDAYDADEETARRAAKLISGRTVLTFSHSSTVVDAICNARPSPTVLVAESRPGAEGRTAAERLHRAGCDVTLLPDAAIANAFDKQRIDLVITGADTILSDGSVINKTGSQLAALAASYRKVPFYAACARDKVSASEQVDLSDEAPSFLDRDINLKTFNPMFERVPADLVAGVITETGNLTTEAIYSVADEMRELEEWQATVNE